MKRILLPLTARPHRARMKLLIEELGKYFDLDLWEPKERKGDMAVNAILYGIEFNNYLAGKDYDAIIIRGDRYEMGMLAIVGAYKNIPLIHIEGGDMSGVIDNKIRHCITQLADFHFVTNEESHKRLINMGVATDRVWNFGSLDVEFASKVEPKQLREEPYLLIAYHPIEGEDEKEVDKALENFKDYVKIRIGSNTDYGKKYGEEEFSPEDYINLMRGAKVCIGNSSSLLKEASILEVPVVNIGGRQDKRLKPKNVLDVLCESNRILQAILYQWQHKFKKDLIYFKENTSQEIASKLKEVL